MSRPPKDQELVVAYGFDQVGLRIPSPVERPEYRIEFVQYGSSELGTNAGGIIFPTGFFEHVEYHKTLLDSRRSLYTSELSNSQASTRQDTIQLYDGKLISNHIAVYV